MKIGYVRVSREEQNTDLQHDALRAAGCDEIHEDKATGATFKRPGLDRAIEALKPGDELIVWKFDRFGRSMLEALTLAIDLDRRGIGFRSLTENFDTKTPLGRGFLGLIAAVAEDERHRNSERTKAGLASARRRGRRLGRPAKLTLAKLAHARKLIEAGESKGGAAELIGVDPSTLRRALNKGK